MTVKKPRLGRGLDALLGGGLDMATAGDKEGELRQLPIELLKRGKYQPRHHMREEALQELAVSIRAQGVVQPIVVRELPTGEYEIIAGERRWRASQLAGLDSIPAVVRNIPDEAAIAVALIENIQRENLNPVEEASALQRLIDEFGMTHQLVADAVGRSRAAVSNLLRLLTLNEDVRKMVDHGDLDMGHARALLGLTGTAQSSAAREVVSKDLSVRETERLVRKYLESSASTKKTKSGARLDPDVRMLQEKLSDTLGARVRIIQTAKGGGKLTIDFNSNDELDGILAHIK
ncbi:MAG: ParB/RepB/Spo0J family partition protein [Gammaproteobacteria bacterium]|nr:ParB/RepB/Spo0J family partition protein [Gammaproteobacteria bacterium]